jgi:molybdenum cofactor guanylyltransferase
MGRDKGSLVYHGMDQRSHCSGILETFCDDVFVSIRKEQKNILPAGLKPVFDMALDIGPAAGILAAHERNPEVAWLVLACDMPNVTSKTISSLVTRRDPSRAATAFVLSGEIEPLFAIWESEALAFLKREVQLGRSSPRHTLEKLNSELLQGDPSILKSVNFRIS